MSDLFPGYYRPTKEQFAQMWQECIFVFDANMLLNIYRYTLETREELFDIMEQLQSRIWLPHQVMLEYLENREEVISDQNNIYDEIQAALTEVSDRIKAKYHRGHPFADTLLITKIIEEAKQKIIASIHEAQSRYPNLLENDILRERITNLFSGRIGDKFPPNRLEEIYQEFEQRFRLLIPPGYRDAKKVGFKKYGDGVLWFQIIDHAKDVKKPIIFIIDDRKEDWWKVEKGKTMGPRPELIGEMYSTAQVTFYMYTAGRFMEYAREFLGIEVGQKAIEEAVDLEKQHQEVIIELEDSVKEFLSGLPAHDQTRILAAIRTLPSRDASWPFVAHLVSEEGNLWILRVNNYRLIYSISSDGHIVVLDGFRKNRASITGRVAKAVKLRARRQGKKSHN